MVIIAPTCFLVREATLMTPMPNPDRSSYKKRDSVSKRHRRVSRANKEDIGVPLTGLDKARVWCDQVLKYVYKEL